MQTRKQEQCQQQQPAIPNEARK